MLSLKGLFKASTIGLATANDNIYIIYIFESEKPPPIIIKKNKGNPGRMMKKKTLKNFYKKNAQKFKVRKSTQKRFGKQTK